MKKSLMLLTLTAMTVTIVGCGGPASSTVPDSSTSTPVVSTPAPSSKHDVSSPITPSTGVSSSTGPTSSSTSSSSSSSSSTSVIDKVGDLTQSMLNEIANPNITVNGQLIDIVHSNIDNKDTLNEYSTKVMMDEGKWYGEYKIQDPDIATDETISDNYRKGEPAVVGGVSGHSMDQVYINKDNEVAQKPITDYLSNKTLWESAHLWNHMNELKAGKFEYDPSTGAYVYQIDYTTSGDELYSPDAWLMTYIPYSLSPLVEDTAAEFSVYLNENGSAIDRIECSTDIIYYGYSDEANPAADATSFSYSTMTFEFEAIGTTVVPDPAVYEAPLQATYLIDALNNMKGQTNYTFASVNTTTSAPSGSDDDYDIQTVLSAPVKAKVQNTTSETGTIGRVGKVTENAILYADTDEYSYTMDGKNFHTEYSGYKQNADNTYETFVYDTSAKTLAGQIKYDGTIVENIIPGFDFSPNVFRYDGGNFDAQGNMTQRFVLRDSIIARDVALQISEAKYASDATGSLTANFSINVDGNGNIVSTSFPYSLVSGTYLGICTTTYSDVGTTVLDSDLFDGYIPALRPTAWSELKDIRYFPNGSTLEQYAYDDADVLLTRMYGSDVASFPSPAELIDILGPELHGPWYEVDFDTKHSEFSFTFSTSEVDENARITNFDELLTKIENLLITTKGFNKSPSNSSLTNPNNRHVTYIKDEIFIRIENLGTRYFYFDCYVTSERV